ncbi:acyl transferase [Flagellimonas pelagia]|uniref:Acyl transferase n=1 Tax=Flagellimonas pelagia TaxID=2306998 RepID=A0A3A1NM90_9FLAO|nr:acyl transferase [Allomuricauda maritima]RIV44116.1 acyl transferase [Allomuricauda maritima]TXJ94025.1 acyl transferase [Allomuricauda maritima]
MRQINTDRIFSIANSKEFEAMAWEQFRFQYHHNTIYKTFCDLLDKPPSQVGTLLDIPFLPIEFFKTHKVVSSSETPQAIFESSGTTQNTTSKHFVPDLSLYEKSFLKGFSLFYGPVEECCILALLPAYLERKGSSLVYMVNEMVSRSYHPDSGFYLYDLEALHQKLMALEKRGTKTLLIGVSFALLDLAEQFPMKLQNTIIMETGGMKGRRKELIREELHGILTNAFGVPSIHSEYGMTELLSQAYSKGNGLFTTPPWMKIVTRDTEDPLSLQTQGKTGGINIIDLANVYSCSFIATQDLGKTFSEGSFEVLGRFDSSDIRGCNLMVL